MSSVHFSPSGQSWSGMLHVTGPGSSFTHTNAQPMSGVGLALVEDELADAVEDETADETADDALAPALLELADAPAVDPAGQLAEPEAQPSELWSLCTV